jgi:hypothetical protein
MLKYHSPQLAHISWGASGGKREGKAQTWNVLLPPADGRYSGSKW